MVEINNSNNQTDKMDVFTNDQEKPVNESTGMYVRGFVKISDPESGEILVQTAD
jgi:hypothetical protein